MNTHPIGVIDSGVGGLSIWQEIVKVIPSYPTIYIADSKNCPYGAKTDAEIYALASKMVVFLVSQNVEMIVIACNTISVVALDALRKDFPQVTFVGTVPAIKKASSITKNQKIGILATQSTAQSRYLSTLITQFANNHRVIVVGSQKLVPYVEQGIIRGEGLHKVLQEELTIFQKEDIDTLVLGCSHFPFLKDAIQEIFHFPYVIDSADAIASQVKRLVNPNDASTSSHLLYTTGDALQFEDTAATLLDLDRLGTIQKVGHITL